MLSRAVQEGYRQLSPHRDQYRDSVQEYLGRNCGEGDGIRRPINLIANDTNTLVSNLVSDVPKHRVRSPLAEFRGEAAMLEIALDRLWDDNNTLTDVRMACFDAILGFGSILRLGMRAGKEYVTMDSGHHTPVAEPYCRHIPLEDWCCDPAARSQQELRWEAVRYRMPRWEAIESGVFGRNPQDYGPDEPVNPDTATRAEAEQIIGAMPGLQGQSSFQEDISSLNRTPGADTHSLIDTVEFWDVILYLGGEIWTVTIPASHDKSNAVPAADKWLLCERWEGPDPGPIVMLTLRDIPGQPIGKPVAADWRDLHDFCRIVSNKLAREVENSKVVHMYSGTGEDDALAVKNAADSGLVRVQDPQSVVTTEISGVVKNLMPALAWGEREHANASGNLPLTGGQSSDATEGTATAAQYLQANASQMIREMRNRIEAVEASIDRHYGFYLTTDPMVKLPLPYRLQGGETITLHYDAATRRGDFQAFNFDIERYSSVGQDPNVRTKRVVEFLGIVMQMAPLIQAGVVGMEGLANLGEQEFGIENLDELLPGQGQGLQMQQMQTLAGAGPPGMGQPQQTPGLMPQNPAQFGQQQPGHPGMGQPQPRPQNNSMTPMDAGRSALSVGVGQ